MAGWIKVYRDLLDKPIWTGSTPEQKIVLIYFEGRNYVF